MLRSRTDLSLFVAVAQEERDTISSLCAFWTDCIMVPKKLPDTATILEAVSSVGMGRHLLNNEIPKFLRLAGFYEEKKAEVNLDDVRYSWNRLVKALDVVNFKFNSLYDKVKPRLGENYPILHNFGQLPIMDSATITLSERESEEIAGSIISISDDSQNENINEDNDFNFNLTETYNEQTSINNEPSRTDVDDDDDDDDNSENSSNKSHSLTVNLDLFSE